MGLRIKSVVSTNHRFYFGNRRHVKNQFWYLENRFYIRCWLLKTSRKTKKRGRAPKNFSINQGSFGEFLKTGSKPMQHHKPIPDITNRFHIKCGLFQTCRKTEGPQKIFKPRITMPKFINILPRLPK